MSPQLDLNNLPEALTGGESRQLIGMSVAIWMEYLEQDLLPKPIKIGNRYKWRKSDILKWVAERKAEGMFSEGQSA